MSLAKEHFRALIESKPLPEQMDALDAAATLKQLIGDTQQLTLSQLPSANARQLGSILFSHEAGLISAFSTVNEPKVIRKKGGSVKSLNFLFIMLALLTAVGAFCMVWQADLYLWALFIGASALLSGAAYFAPRRDDAPAVRQSIDMKALTSLTERRMEAIDRDLDAFLSIPAEGSGDDDAIVQIISLAVSMKKQDPESVPDELMTAITTMSISRGYDFIDCTEETEAFFDTMPTKRESRTIVPAVLKDGALIARGMAIVKIDPNEEVG